MSKALEDTTVTAADADVLLTASKVVTAAVAHSLAQVEEQVTAPGLRVLVMLDASGPMNLSGVADGLGVNASTASRTCDRLVLDGLIDRRDAEVDRRQVALSLTTRGRSLVDRLLRERLAVLVRVVETMPPTARRRLVRGLQDFIGAAAELDAVHAESDDADRSIVRWHL